MSDWFTIEQIAPGVLRITEPHVHEFFRANLYWIEGRDLDIMLDFGMGLSSLRSVLPRRGRPVLAVATHAHVDHVGSFHEFEDRAGHPLEADIFVEMDDAGTFASWFAGMPDALSQLPSPGFDPRTCALKPAPLTRLLVEGDVIDTGDRRFSVLHLPGHSPGSIALLDEVNGEFFAGDAIYDGGLVDDIAGADIRTYVETMRRIAELEVRIVHGGHGESFDQARMREIARAYIDAKSVT